MSSIVLPPKNFVTLHAHSTFSPFDGLGYPKDHIDFVLKNEMDAWALTDHGNGNGLAHAHTYARKLKKSGQKYRQVYGVEFYFVPSLKEWKQQYEDYREKNKNGRKNLEDEQGGHVIEDENESKSFGLEDQFEWKRRYHLVVVAKNRAGIKNLFSLVKRSYKEGFYRFPRIDFAMLKQHAEGLIVSTACVAGMPAAISCRGEARGKSFEQIQLELENMSDYFVDCVGVNNFFLELQFNALDSQHTSNRHLLSLSDKTGIGLIATADSHYPSPDKWEVRELYRRLGRMSFKDQVEGVLPDFDDLKCELYPKNALQMWESYKKHAKDFDFYDGKDQIISDAIQKTHDLVWQECEEIWFDSVAKLPNFVNKQSTAFDQLVSLTKKAMVSSELHANPDYVQRVKDELSDIKFLGFENYFLTLYKVFQKAENRTLIGPGRGSGAGSLVNYLLGITSVDPIKYDLLWERFLHRNKAGWPDIDTDAGNRDVLIEEARLLFGDDDVIPVSNFNTLKLKSLVKDVSKFFGVPFEEVNAVTGPLEKEVEPRARGANTEKSTYVMTHEDCMKHSSKYYEFMQRYPRVKKHVVDLFMQNRSIGRHAGGVLICPKLENFMPVIGVRGELQTSWSEGMNFRHLEENGFLKFDFLGLNLLQMVEDCIRLVLRKKENKEPTFLEIKKFFDENLNCRYHDLDDGKVWKYVYAEGRFPLVFQFTNDGARKFCTEAKPESITELAAITAIYRPGPLRANVHKKYVKVKNSPDKIIYDHPVIEEVLSPTLGFICFQEQFMMLGQKLAGFDPGESDQMRKTLVKKSLDSNDKKAGERELLKKKFIEGAQRLHGLGKKITGPLWKNIEFFSQYGFNASHAVSYAIDSYYSAWLMTHHEKEWLATCLQSEMINPVKMAKIISEVKQLGYKIFPVDINESSDVWVYSSEKEGFVAPLSAVKGVGDKAVEEIIESRPYTDLHDLFFNQDGRWKHSKMNKTCFSSLCKVEAFSSLTEFQNGTLENHNQLLNLIVDNYDSLRKGRKGTGRKKKEDLPDILPPAINEVCEILDWTRKEKIEMQKEILNSVDNDLLFPDAVLNRLDKSKIAPIGTLRDDNRGIVWFCITDVYKKKSKNGKDFFRLKVTDDKFNTQWLRVWGSSEKLVPYSIWIADVKSDPNWGCSTSVAKIRRLVSENG